MVRRGAGRPRPARVSWRRGARPAGRRRRGLRRAAAGRQVLSGRRAAWDAATSGHLYEVVWRPRTWRPGRARSPTCGWARRAWSARRALPPACCRWCRRAWGPRSAGCACWLQCPGAAAVVRRGRRARHRVGLGVGARRAAAVGGAGGSGAARGVRGRGRAGCELRPDDGRCVRGGGAGRGARAAAVGSDGGCGCCGSAMPGRPGLAYALTGAWGARPADGVRRGARGGGLAGRADGEVGARKRSSCLDALCGGFAGRGSVVMVRAMRRRRGSGRPASGRTRGSRRSRRAGGSAACCTPRACWRTGWRSGRARRRCGACMGRRVRRRSGRG